MHCMLASSRAGQMPALVMHRSCRKASCAQRSSGCTVQFCRAWRVPPLASTGSHAPGIKSRQATHSALQGHQNGDGGSQDGSLQQGSYIELPLDDPRMAPVPHQQQAPRLQVSIICCCCQRLVPDAVQMPAATQQPCGSQASLRGLN